MTEKLFYKDPYKKEFDAGVVEIEAGDENYRIVLDTTCFYPEGGGQPADTGLIGDVAVFDTRKEGENVIHLCNEKPSFQPGNVVHGTVEWGHRFDFMQQHSGQHVISGVLFAHEGINTLSVHMGLEYTTIEVDVPSISRAAIDAVEDAANKTIWENLEIDSSWVEDSDISSLNLRRAPKVRGKIRIVQIKGADRVACGGVHVRRTSEVGIVKSIGVEFIRGHARLVWKIGRRAIEDYRVKTDTCRSLVDTLSAPLGGIVAAVEDVVNRLSAQKRETIEVQQKYAEVIAKYLIMRPDYAIAHEFQDEERGFLKLVARSLLEGSRPFCLVNLQDEAVQWCVGLPGNGSKEILAELLPIIDGKGGGKPPLWQGVGSGSEKAHEFLERFAEIVKNLS